ncbi:MAG: protein translocase subunit SecF [Candidatus Pacebacteria bacterium]|nr:protein translocase subunit SecF [Candidatus Paceibacterota bacterium]
MRLQFVKYRRIFYTLSLILTVLSLVVILIFGLKWGIDFTGGSLMEFGYKQQAPSQEVISEKLRGVGLGDFSLQKAGENKFILKTKSIDEKTHQDILLALKALGDFDEGAGSFESIGPAVGAEMRNKIQIVVILSILVILVYIAISFRRVSRPVKSYIYGLTSIIALVHDVLIPLGIFVILGKIYGVEVTIPIITALLTVFGYSINDSVVVFDRLRENLLRSKAVNFETAVDDSLNQTLGRSVNTSVTVLITLFAIFFFGGETLRFFSLALILGIGFGTYSSIFIATLLLFSFYRFQEKRKGR